MRYAIAVFRVSNGTHFYPNLPTSGSAKMSLTDSLGKWLLIAAAFGRRRESNWVFMVKERLGIVNSRKQFLS
jgi:hypothetical protein